MRDEAGVGGAAGESARVILARFRRWGNRARRRARARSVGLRRRKREPDPLAIILFHHSDRKISRILEDEHEQEHDFSTSAFRFRGTESGSRFFGRAWTPGPRAGASP